MLKRYQVLLPDWMEDGIKHYVKKYKISFSEAIRAEICASILATVPKQFSEYKPDLTHEDMVTMIKKMTKEKMTREEVKRLLSRVYFEARKAAEYRLGKEKELKKK